MAGPAAARNTILSAARGEFIAFFDDDDESLPDRISTQVKTLTAYEHRIGTSLIACYASGIRRYPNGYSMALPAIGSRGRTAPSGTAVVDYLLTFRLRPGYFYGSGTPACSLMTRRSTLAAVGGFDPELRRVEDADFAIRLALLGGHFVGTPEILFVQHSTSAPDKSPEQNLEAQQRLVSKYRDYLEKIGWFEYARRWRKLRYWHFSRRYGHFTLELFGAFCALPVHGHAASPQYRPAAASAREPYARPLDHVCGRWHRMVSVLPKSLIGEHQLNWDGLGWTRPEAATEAQISSQRFSTLLSAVVRHGLSADGQPPS